MKGNHECEKLKGWIVCVTVKGARWKRL